MSINQNHCPGGTGMVYIMTNAVYNNKVAAFRRESNGTLTFMNLYSTGGGGTDGGVDPLSSQGSLIMACRGSYLFAVNAGTNTISSFRAAPSGETHAGGRDAIRGTDAQQHGYIREYSLCVQHGQKRQQLSLKYCRFSYPRQWSAHHHTRFHP